MPIRFKCTACNKPMRAPDDYGGVVINCPKCGASIKVPAGEESGAASAAAASSPAPSKPTEPAKVQAGKTGSASSQPAMHQESRVVKDKPFPAESVPAPAAKIKSAAKTKPIPPAAPPATPKSSEQPSPASEPDRTEFADFGLSGSSSDPLSDPVGATANDSAENAAAADDDLWNMLSSESEGDSSADDDDSTPATSSEGLGTLDPELAAAAGFDSALGESTDDEPAVADASSSSVDSVGVGREFFDDTRLGSNVSPGLSSLDLDEGSIVAPVRERETATADPSRALPTSSAAAASSLELSPSFWPALALVDVVLLSVTLYLAAGAKNSTASVEVRAGANLATVQSVEAAQAAGYTVIEVDAENGLRLASQPLADLSDLHSRLATQPPARVVVVASGGALHETVMGALSAATGAGVADVRLATARD